MSKILRLFFLFVIFFLVHLSSPSAQAQSVGSHLGEGDVGTQISNIDILKANGAGPGFPVTAMLNIQTAAANQQEMRNLHEAINSAGFTPIIRLTHVCNREVNNSVIDNAINNINSLFGNDVPIIYGNEVNNRDHECKDSEGGWPKYAQELRRAISISSNVVPAALDFYMGVPIYSAQAFIQESGLEDVYSTSGLYAANAYGCVGLNVDTCVPDHDGYKTYSLGYSYYQGSVILLTEFSLSPEGRKVDAPDIDLDKVRDFIVREAGNTGASLITPLVRNVCNNEGEWLLYVNGRFFTTAGTEVTNDCRGITGIEYDLRIYPEYDIINELFFNYPIVNVTGANRTPANLRKELALQGYEAYCASENIHIEPIYNTRELISTFLRLNPSGIYLETDSVSGLNTTGTRYPIWRDVSGKQHLFASMEEYFGFRDVYEDDSARTVMTSSPINNLLSRRQLCVQGWENVVAMRISCERLENIDECALRNRAIPPHPVEETGQLGSGLTVDSLITMMSDFYELNAVDPDGNTVISGIDGGAVEACTILMNSSSLEDIRLREGLINTPTYFDRAYRYGFIVAVIKAKSPGTAEGNVASRIFNFFNSRTRSEIPEDELLVAAFKLPDIGTNKGGGDDTASQFWNDPLDLTRQLLTTKEQQFYHESESRLIGQDEDGEDIRDGQSRSEHRREILQLAENHAVQKPNDRIYCVNGQWGGSGIHSITCQNALHKALADIINGNAQDCGQSENVVSIFDMGGFGDVTDPYGKIFQSNSGGRNLIELFGISPYNLPTDGGVDMQVARTNIDGSTNPERMKTLWSIFPDSWGPAVPDTTVSYYLVYPKGFEINAVQEAIQGAFFTQEQIARMNAPVENFDLAGITRTLDGGTVFWDFEDTDATKRGDCGQYPSTEEYQVYDPETETWTTIEAKKGDNIPCMRAVNINIRQESSGVGVGGARLGWWLRQVQTTLNSRVSVAHHYFSSCETMEQFLTGNCLGGSLGLGDKLSPGGDNGQCEIVDDGFCSPEYLKPFFVEAGFVDPTTEARHASMVCRLESGGNPANFNAGCLDRSTVDYSVGLFQINMLWHCRAGFADGSGTPGTNNSYDPFIMPCQIIDQNLINSCANSLVAIDEKVSNITGLPIDSQAAVAAKADANIRKMIELRRDTGSWKDWRNAANTCGLKI